VRGRFLHNDVLVAPVAALLREYGVQSQLEHATESGRGTTFVDLLAVRESLRLVCEAELSPDRVWNDVNKAVSLEANLLLIVVPNARIARRVRRRLSRLTVPMIPESLDIWILPLGPALQRLREKLSLMTRVNVPRTLSHQTTPPQSGNDRNDLTHGKSDR